MRTHYTLLLFPPSSALTRDLQVDMLKKATRSLIWVGHLMKMLEVRVYTTLLTVSVCQPPPLV